MARVAAHQRTMRVRISGGATRESALIAGVLAQNGFVIAEAGTPFDLRLTLAEGSSERISCGDLMLDSARREATRSDRSVRLTGIECALLATLMRADGALTKDALLATVWGYAFDPGTNVVAVHISRLRHKIGTDAIIFTPDGYRLAY